jgi:hypothetical protein
MPHPSDLQSAIQGLVTKSLERVQVRSRHNDITQSAWRLETTSPNGTGAITLVEISPSESHYRGEGTFLGWSQEELAVAYSQLIPKSTDSGPETPQLG